MNQPIREVIEMELHCNHMNIQDGHVPPSDSVEGPCFSMMGKMLTVLVRTIVCAEFLQAVPCPPLSHVDATLCPPSLKTHRFWSWPFSESLDHMQRAGLCHLATSQVARNTGVIARAEFRGTSAETRFCLALKRTSPFKSVGASVQSPSGSRRVRISGQRLYYL